MRYINSGSRQIPLISLIAILSISLIVNLPGLAISPLLGKLKSVFPDVSELETQLLIVLPNFVIIPFILWSGKLCNLNNQMRVLAAGLLLYIVSGVLFLFANSMLQLIILSCVLGIGCGLCIPLAASLIAQNFVGNARTKQLGMKSGVSNFTVIFATLFVGWIASIGWHLAFLVYLVPIIPLCLMPFMRRKYIDSHQLVEHPQTQTQPVDNTTPQSDTVGMPNRQETQTSTDNHTKFKHPVLILIGLIGVYIALTNGTMSLSDFLPFTMKHYSMNTTQVGVATSLFFLAATCSGFTLTWVIDTFKNMTPYLALGMCIIGLCVCGLVHIYWVYLIAIFLIGFGYGLMQPIIYDKTASIAPTSEKSTEYFAYTLTGNYIAIALAPFVVDLCAKIFSASTINFPYILDGAIILVVMCIGIFKRKSFVFKIKDV